VINLISSVNSCSTVIVTSDHLSKLVRYLTISQRNLSLFIRLHPTIHPVRVLAAWLDSSPVGEECLVYLEECLLVVDEEVEQVALVSDREVGQLDAVLGELRQSQERLLKLTRLLRVLFYLLKLLLVVDLVLKATLHYILAHFFNAIYE
jgi:hypothetical protein